jgi:putative addiction module CopG family antidote
MTTLSVPLTPELESFIENQVQMGRAETKSEVIRRALVEYEREEAIRAVLESHKEALQGKVFSGDLDGLAKKIK